MKKINLWTISLILSIFVCPTAAGQDTDGQFTIATLNVDGLPQKILVVKVNADGPGNGGTARIGKYLLRHAFEQDDLIPREILMREKAAFSDAVGHSMRRDLMDYAETLYTDEEYETKRQGYTHAMPFTKESLLYREIFEKYYPGQAQMVADFWMPNKSWEGCDVNDPSASVLSNYGASGL